MWVGNFCKMVGIKKPDNVLIAESCVQSILDEVAVTGGTFIDAPSHTDMDCMDRPQVSSISKAMLVPELETLMTALRI